MTKISTQMLDADGIPTRVSVVGRGEPLLMFSPGGFDATLEKWSELGIYKKIDIMSYLAERFTCILFDRRECGKSGGRLEILDFSGMARHGHAVLEQLGYGSAHVIGGCLGCAPASEFARLYPNLTMSLNLVWPVGGARYRIRNFGRFSTPPGLGLGTRDRCLDRESARQRRRVRERLNARPVGRVSPRRCRVSLSRLEHATRRPMRGWYRRATGPCSTATVHRGRGPRN